MRASIEVQAAAVRAAANAEIKDVGRGITLFDAAATLDEMAKAKAGDVAKYIESLKAECASAESNLRAALARL
jgi:hypothetical protein